MVFGIGWIESDGELVLIDGADVPSLSGILYGELEVKPRNRARDEPRGVMW